MPSKICARWFSAAINPKCRLVASPKVYVVVEGVLELVESLVAAH
jgi:hypothetical protein